MQSFGFYVTRRIVLLSWSFKFKLRLSSTRQIVTWAQVVRPAESGDPTRGFREPGEWGPKQPGSREQDAKTTRDRGAEENNLGSRHRVCHKMIIMLFYTMEIFGLASLDILHKLKIHDIVRQWYTSGVSFDSGSKSIIAEGAGGYQI